jgi:hypothetical protein
VDERPGAGGLLVWWLGWVAAGSLYSFASRLGIGAETLDELRQANAAFLAADVLSAVVAALALVVVVRTTRRQTNRAAGLGVVPEEDATPVWRRRSAWAALVAILAGFGLQAGVAVAGWSGALDPEESAATPEPPAGSPAGTLFGDDFSREGVWLVDDTPTYTTDYVDGSYRVLLKKQGMYSSGQALLEEADGLSVEADATLHAGDVRADFYGVTCLPPRAAATCSGHPPTATTRSASTRAGTARSNSTVSSKTGPIAASGQTERRSASGPNVPVKTNARCA